MIDKSEVMKAIRKRLKITAAFITTLMLFQSCVVYHRTPTTLEKASLEQTRTKVTQTNDQTFKYKYITHENGIYYGVNKKSGQLVKTPLDPEYVSKVRIKNKSASAWVTVAVIGVPVIFIIIGLAIAEVGLEPGYGWSVK